MADAPVLGAGSSECEFESHLPHHVKNLFCLPAKEVFYNDIRSCRNG